MGSTNNHLNGKRRVTTRDIARAAGVSQPTVSRALAGDDAISDATRNRVLAVAKRLNYPTSRLQRAPSLLARRKRVIGVVVAALHNSFYTYFVGHLHDELAAAGYSMVLMIDQFEHSADLSKLQGLLDGTLAGVLFTTATIHSAAVQLLYDRGIPLVLAVRSVSGLPVDTIESDNVMAGRDAIRHLTSLGHRRIGFVLGPRDTSTSLQRFEGAAQELAGHGQTVSPELLIWSDYSHEAGYSGLLRLAKAQPPPTALICGNDVVALGALDAARKQGIAVPEAMSIVGFDDIPMAGWAMVQLTTVRQGIEAMATLAARRMLERVQAADDLPPRHDVLPTSLVLRGTTAPPQR
ncbi:MAG: LacI family DNA-binding transcriptional regulator [Verrucomicrobia bacterium]|nr:LacI family DNA-binding transcriptional regulator [Verrucomicrobiota bacterium]